MALNMIVVIHRDSPDVVFAYHTSGQSITVSEVYPADTYQAFRIPFDSKLQVGDVVDVSEGVEIDLIA